MKKECNLSQKEISGWSNTNFSFSDVVVPETIEEIRSTIETAKKSRKTVLACGSGQSYGDEALNNGQIVIDMKKINRIIDWDKSTGLLRVEVGATYDDVLTHCLKDNWTLAVIPGTRHVTMGGALANNVHGKNSYALGNFGEWVQEFKIILASLEIYTCSKKENSEIFFAAIGGAGLLGIVTEITLQLIPVPSPYLSIKNSTASGLTELMNGLDNAAKKNGYAIAQVDCFPETFMLGRGTIHAGSFVSSPPDAKKVETMRNISKQMFFVFPKKWVPTIGKYILSDFTMRWISRLKYYLDKLTNPKKPFRQDVFEFTFLLDQVPNWKKAFRYGFFEYEPLIPKEKAREVFRRLIALGHEYGMPSYLSAIKVHHKDNFMLSYSLDGYSFGIDIPRRPSMKGKQDDLFRKMNEIVISAGGMTYLAKDAHLTPGEFRRMYKNVEQFLELKNKYDPEEIFQSNMYRRIFNNK